MIARGLLLPLLFERNPRRFRAVIRRSGGERPCLAWDGGPEIFVHVDCLAAIDAIDGVMDGVEAAPGPADAGADAADASP